MKKPKTSRPEVPVYGAAGSTLSLDALSAAARSSTRPELFQLAEWLNLIHGKLAADVPKSKEARDFAEECRKALTDIFLYTYEPPVTEAEIYRAMLRSVELGTLFQAYAAANNLPVFIQTRAALSAGGKARAAQIHSTEQKAKTRARWRSIERRCSELIRASTDPAKALATLHREFGVKPGTLRKHLIPSGHLPRARRNPSS